MKYGIEWAINRYPILNELTSRELAGTLSSNIRMHTFFSAQVSKLHVIEQLQEVSNLYTQGKLGKSEARQMLKKYLQTEGYTSSDDSQTIPDGVDEIAWEAARKLTNLASTARLNLILQQNADMANAVGQYMSSTDVDIVERYPYWRYRCVYDARAEHKAFDGKIFRKDDPIWSSIYPPRDFNCRCWVEDVGDEDLPKGKYKAPTVADRDLAKTPNDSGYSFNPKEAFKDVSLNSIQTAQHRVEVLSKIKAEIVKDKALKRFSVIGKQPDPKVYSENPIAGEKRFLESFNNMQKDVENLFKEAGLPTTTQGLRSGGYDYKKINDAIQKHGVNQFNPVDGVLNKFPEQISIGRLSKETLDSIGFPNNEDKVFLSKGDGKTGVTHLWANHKDVILDPKEAKQILAETVGNRGAQTALSLIKKGENQVAERLVIFNEKKGSYCVMDKVDDHFEIVSFHRAELNYGENQWKRIQKQKR